MSGVLRLRKHLSGVQPAPAWPEGVHLVPVAEIAPQALHAILDAGYVDGFGSVLPFVEWWTSIVSDEEFDPEILFIAADASGEPVGLALCWNSGFIKDIAVNKNCRGKGIGEGLLHAAFATFAARGVAYVDLKVVAATGAAIRLYHRVGMVEASL